MGKSNSSTKNQLALRQKLFGPISRGRRITGNETPEEILMNCHPAFGGKQVRQAYELLDQAIGMGHTIFASVAGPITASDYSRVWLIPFMEAGWISTLTASDAISYHDAHDAVQGKREVHDVDMYGDDGKYRQAHIIRITDLGFPEEVLFNTDSFISWVLTQPEFQGKMTTTEYRNNLGKYIGALERKRGVPPGLLSSAAELDVPIFCPSPADGSTFLNADKLWLLQRLGVKLPRKHSLEIDLQKDVYEFCAYHYWSQHNEGNRKLACLILGGGAVKNYTLQPEPALSQIFFIPTDMYSIDVQMTTAPVTDGSLSSATPSEAESWGKVKKGAGVVSVSADYTMLMSFISYALLDKRNRLQRQLEEKYHGNRERFFRKFPEARGFLREPARLYSKRDGAMAYLDNAARKHVHEMMKSLRFKS